MFNFRIEKLVIPCIIIIMIISCGGRKVKPGLAANERLEVAKEMMADEDYLDAKQQLTIITLSHQGTAIADDAQYFLAECHFYLKEYILAVSEYQRLLKAYPSSEYIDDAQYKMGLSYYNLSPSFGLDQDYTFKAIQHFQRFLEDFPGSPHRPNVEKYLGETRKKLAKKEYNSGNLYRKLDFYTAAIVYFDSVLNNYYDTDYAEKAMYWKGVCLSKLDRYVEAKEVLQYYIVRYPNGDMTEKAREQLDEAVEKSENDKNQ